MKTYPDIVKDRLSSLISKMAETSELYVKNPGKDFTRNRKLPFSNLMHLLISMGGNSIGKELLEAQGYLPSTASVSAFVQQRDKILPSAFERLLLDFVHSYPDAKTYRGYRVLAIDGSALQIPTNPDDPQTYVQNKPGLKGCNRLHLNALYDLCNKLYVDAMVQPVRTMNEHRALVSLVDRSTICDRTIVIADRGYESYNDFAHIQEKGWSFLIRVKDRNSSGILSGLQLPSSDTFDVCCRLLLTRNHSNHVRKNRHVFRFISSTTPFDFLSSSSDPCYPLSLRIIRIEIAPDSFETLITNLPDDQFSPTQLKELYHLRWGIETSFRDLKYSVGLMHFHAKKAEHIVQEIFARIIMYNFAQMITSHIIISQTCRTHAYQVNFNIAVHICRFFLRSRGNAHPPDVEALIRKNILPIRPDRHNARNIRYKSVASFTYRIS